MVKQELEITITPQGDVRIEVIGVKGKSCVDLTKPLEDALGSEVESRTYTSTYYEYETRVQQKQG